MGKPNKPSQLHGIFRSLGPGLITACVVIGPGSILTSSTVGAKYGFQLTWVLVIAVALMMVYMTMGARLGVVAKRAPGDLLREHVGAWLPALIGISVFCISSSYQFGNNLGVASAFDVYLPQDMSRWARLGILISLLAVFNGLAIAFLFAFKDLYRSLEVVMSGFVLLMLSAFLLNLLLVRPDLRELLAGFVPRRPDTDGGTGDLLAIVGWIGTTFITAIAYYQCYLVRMKGWSEANLRDGLRDARIGSLILASITLMIMCTAATALRGESLDGVGQVARQLHQLSAFSFEGAGQLIFCTGLFCAAYSSFLVNSMIGGFLLSDGLKLGATPDHRAPRAFAATILVVGFVVASITLISGIKPVPAIVFAQAITVLVAPIIGGVLWWLTANRKIMGDKAIGIAGHIGAACGIAVLLILSAYLVFRILKTVGVIGE